MGTQLDIVGSIILLGLLILGFGYFMSDKQSSEYMTTAQVTAQKYMSDISSTIMFDLRKVGYGVPSGTPFIFCSPTALSFMGDIDNNGSVDTVEYRFATPATNTVNPSDSLIYHRVTGKHWVVTDAGVVGLRFRYYNCTGSETSDKALIKHVAVQLRIQSRFPVDGEYAESFSEFRISPKNIH